MPNSQGPSVSEGVESEAERRESLVRRYSTRVTVGVILLCNAVFLAGIWISGVDLDRLIRMPDEYNPRKDICVRYGWHRVAGVEKPIRLCAEWINLSDPSGETHKFRRDTAVVKGGDGKLYFEHAPRMGYRLVLVLTFILVIIGAGIALNRYLITRYRARLEETSAVTSCIIH